LLAAGRRPEELGLGRSHLGGRLLGGVALAAVLLLPAAARWGGGAGLAPALGGAAVAGSGGGEGAFRGVLFAALQGADRPAGRGRPGQHGRVAARPRALAPRVIPARGDRCRPAARRLAMGCSGPRRTDRRPYAGGRCAVSPMWRRAALLSLAATAYVAAAWAV